MQMQPGGGKLKTPLIVTVAVIAALLVVVLVWYFVLREPSPAVPVVETPAGASLETPDLGSQVYEEASNPISGELPETAAPLSNPIEGAYQNPFGQ